MRIDIEFHSSSLTVIIYRNRNKNSQPLCLRLTRSEFLILREFASYPGQHLSKHHLIEVGWPNMCIGPNSLTMVIMSLRKKLTKAASFWEIVTIHRIGYSMSLSPLDLDSRIKIINYEYG
ncbi:helix-turn-helix domain-containing protein [Vibrio jasicida]|uniref:helix-turn-helix domain-containing protein n=1 Tax=Vibrio jasicida TaxID=766224 RepID=UPI0009DBEF17|nr:helix-turn-helix domain-containing protein [Vibrio jasicida]